MENAAEALKMAGGVLLFLIALSVSIISFSHVRQAADTILEYKDRETEYIDSDYYYQVGINESERASWTRNNITNSIKSIHRKLQNYI